MSLRVEARLDRGGRLLWVPIGVVAVGDPPGSMSHNTLDRRDLIVFVCVGDRSVVSRSLGADMEVGAMRAVFPLGEAEVLASLAAGQTYETDIVTDSGAAYRVRWTHE
jgi:hypothetical protein